MASHDPICGPRITNNKQHTVIVHPKKTDNITRLNAEARYDYFIRKVVDFKTLWGLVGTAGWVTAGNDAVEVIPFWPEQAFATLCAEHAWADSVPKAIPLQHFIECWLPGMQRDTRQCLIFPTVQHLGLWIAPNRLAQDLAAEIKSYEQCLSPQCHSSGTR